MSRYRAMFERCRARDEGAFGAFLMLGDPDPKTCAAYLDALVAGGADMVELGIPFSDPVADGPVIQAAAERALAAGLRTADCLDLIRSFRARHADIPVGILTYANIVAARGIDEFCRMLAEAGADSLLVADVPSLEAEPYAAAARLAGLDLVMISAPNTPRETLKRIAGLSNGYSYCVARAGVTGADSLLVADVPSLEAEPYAAAARLAGLDLVMISAPNTPRETLKRIAGLSNGYSYCVARAGVTGADERLELDHQRLFATLADLGAPPPVLGFGISKPEQVQQAFEAGAAGVISGSAIVRLIAERCPPSVVSDFVRALKEATALVLA